MDKNKKKGFTLVELIVVLAILAILAAMLVPALTGYIDKANEKKILATARQYYVAAQTVVSESYSKGKPMKGISGYDKRITVFLYNLESEHAGRELEPIAIDDQNDPLIIDFINLSEIKNNDVNDIFDFEFNKDGTIHVGRVVSNNKVAMLMDGKCAIYK